MASDANGGRRARSTTRRTKLLRPTRSGWPGSKPVVIARARDALCAAARAARKHGYQVTDLGDQLQAEARHLGASHAALARRLARDGKPRAIVSGGETTVTVVNKPQGRGGRNLEYLLGLAIALDGAPGISALACDTDGIDGTEDAAGAIVTPDTLARARRLASTRRSTWRRTTPMCSSKPGRSRRHRTDADQCQRLSGDPDRWRYLVKAADGRR